MGKIRQQTNGGLPTPHNSITTTTTTTMSGDGTTVGRAGQRRRRILDAAAAAGKGAGVGVGSGKPPTWMRRLEERYQRLHQKIATMPAYRSPYRRLNVLTRKFLNEALAKAALRDSANGDDACSVHPHPPPPPDHPSTANTATTDGLNQDQDQGDVRHSGNDHCRCKGTKTASQNHVSGNNHHYAHLHHHPSNYKHNGDNKDKATGRLCECGEKDGKGTTASEADHHEYSLLRSQEASIIREEGLSAAVPPGKQTDHSCCNNSCDGCRHRDASSSFLVGGTGEAEVRKEGGDNRHVELPRRKTEDSNSSEKSQLKGEHRHKDSAVSGSGLHSRSHLPCRRHSHDCHGHHHHHHHGSKANTNTPPSPSPNKPATPPSLPQTGPPPPQFSAPCPPIKETSSHPPPPPPLHLHTHTCRECGGVTCSSSGDGSGPSVDSSGGQWQRRYDVTADLVPDTWWCQTERDRAAATGEGGKKAERRGGGGEVRRWSKKIPGLAPPADHCGQRKRQHCHHHCRRLSRSVVPVSSAARHGAGPAERQQSSACTVHHHGTVGRQPPLPPLQQQHQPLPPLQQHERSTGGRVCACGCRGCGCATTAFHHGCEETFAFTSGGDCAVCLRQRDGGVAAAGTAAAAIAAAGTGGGAHSRDTSSESGGGGRGKMGDPFLSSPPQAAGSLNAAPSDEERRRQQQGMGGSSLHTALPTNGHSNTLPGDNVDPLLTTLSRRYGGGGGWGEEDQEGEEVEGVLKEAAVGAGGEKRERGGGCGGSLQLLPQMSIEARHAISETLREMGTVGGGETKSQDVSEEEEEEEGEEGEEEGKEEEDYDDESCNANSSGSPLPSVAEPLPAIPLQRRSWHPSDAATTHHHHHSHHHHHQHNQQQHSRENSLTASHRTTATRLKSFRSARQGDAGSSVKGSAWGQGQGQGQNRSPRRSTKRPPSIRTSLTTVRPADPKRSVRTLDSDPVGPHDPGSKRMDLDLLSVPSAGRSNRSTPEARQDAVQRTHLPAITSRTEPNLVTTPRMDSNNVRTVNYRIRGVGSYRVARENTFEITAPDFDIRYRDVITCQRGDRETPPPEVFEKSVGKVRDWLNKYYSPSSSS